MTDTEQSLLTLLRRALFGCELPLPSDVDWQRVLRKPSATAFICWFMTA